MGKFKLRMAQDRTGPVFDRTVRAPSALGASVGGGPGGDVRAGGLDAQGRGDHRKRLDQSLDHFAARPLREAFPYLIVDARYERVREAGVIVSHAVLIAIGIGWDGWRQGAGVELANRESRSSFSDFLRKLKPRGLNGVELVVSDDHAGLKAAIAEVLPEAVWQRCYVRFLRNALDYVPRQVDDDCLQELRWLYARRDLAEARSDLAPGWRAGQVNARGLLPGSKKTLTKPLVSTDSHASITSTAGPPTCSSA